MVSKEMFWCNISRTDVVFSPRKKKLFMMLSCKFMTSEQNVGCFLVLRKALFVSYCVVIWILFLVFCLYYFMSLGDHNIKKLPECWI